MARAFDKTAFQNIAYASSGLVDYTTQVSMAAWVNPALAAAQSYLGVFRDDEEHHLRMCEAAAARFREVVNFDEEEQAIRALFAQVLP